MNEALFGKALLAQATRKLRGGVSSCEAKRKEGGGYRKQGFAQEGGAAIRRLAHPQASAPSAG